MNYEQAKRACEIIGTHADVKDLHAIRNECIENLRELFQKGILTEPQHDECLGLLFAKSPTSDQYPIADNIPIFKIPFPAREPEPPKAA